MRLNSYAAMKDEAALARRIPDGQKHKMLGALREDAFRDTVIRPLYKRIGLQHVRDTCGPDEEGKDCLFVTQDAFGEVMVIAVQTKRGPLNLTSKANTNLVTALTQLRTAAETTVLLPDHRIRTRPSQVHLCACGRISNSARDHLSKEMGAHLLKVRGAEELISLLDEHYPEYWLGVDAKRVPYAKRLRHELSTATDTIRLAEITGEEGKDSPVLDENYVSLRISQLRERRARRHGTTTIEPEFVDAAVESLLDSKERLVLITAEGGAGKTTALRRLALKMTERILNNPDTASVPVLLRAKKIAESASSLSEIAALTVPDAHCQEMPFVAEDLENGRVCVLIDALDEVAEAERDSVLERVVAFHTQFPLCQIVVTARDYRSILALSQLARFTHFMLLPMTAADAMRLVDRVSARKSVDKHVLKTTLRKLNDVHGLSLSPMLVTVFLSSPDFAKQDLPPNIAEIFKKFTELMLGRWDEKKGMRQQFEANTKDFLLRQLAFKMHMTNRRSIPSKEVQVLFATSLAKRDLDIDSDKIFDEIVFRSGLLRTSGHEVEWRHHLLQEFFAGRGVPDADFFIDVAKDEWWRAPMVFYFGEKGESFEDLKRIADRCQRLPAADLFNAAISIGLAVQACYLAEASQKASMLQWVIESLAQGMGAYATGLGRSDWSGKPTQGLCTVLALARDAVGTRTMARLKPQANRAPDRDDALFGPVDRNLAEMWRIVGLLESGELLLAGDALKAFNPPDVDIVFLLWLSVVWVMHVRDPNDDEARVLQRFVDRRAPVIKDHKEKLFQEIRSVLFEIKHGKLAPVPANSSPKPLPAST